MLNLFAATGHINYAKCCRLYLQQMHELPTEQPWVYQCFSELPTEQPWVYQCFSELPTEQPWVYQCFSELPTEQPWVYQCFSEHGFNAVRRNCRYCAGLWTDLVIEQVMMRSIKSRGGLTRGRGMTESVRLQWICSLHKCVAVHDAMSTTTNLKHMTSDQHIELSSSRCKRDFEDLPTVQNGLTSMSRLMLMKEDFVHYHLV